MKISYGFNTQLKEEHVEILRLLDSVKSELSGKDTNFSDLVDDLSTLSELLITHLDLENKLIYPALAKSDDKKTRELGKKFSDEMPAISDVAMAFFEKYLKVDISELKNDTDFKSQIADIANAVEKRVDIEEKVLFPIYEQNYGD